MSQAMELKTSHKKVEWYTPNKYLALADFTLGQIDLDPASDDRYNIQQSPIGTIKKVNNKIYTILDNGLEQKWEGRVFLNPPYGKIGSKSSQGVWSEKLLEEYHSGNVHSAILLVNSALGYEWYEKLYKRYSVCHVKDRIRFWEYENGRFVVGDQAKVGSSFFYFGKDVPDFINYFQGIGKMINV
jgi:hypothetical protein